MINSKNAYSEVNGLKFANEIETLIEEYTNFSIIIVECYYDERNYSEIRAICAALKHIDIEVKLIGKYRCELQRSEIISKYKRELSPVYSRFVFKTID